MPFYELKRQTVTNGSGGTESIHMAGKTVANQETVQLTGWYAAARFGNAGGCILRLYDDNTTAFSGGTAQTPTAKNLRAAPAAQSSWVDDTTTITAGTTPRQRGFAGFAATGGQGGFVPIVPGAAIMMMPNTVNPIDVEIKSVASQASVNFDMGLEIAEGVSA